MPQMQVNRKRFRTYLDMRKEQVGNTNHETGFRTTTKERQEEREREDTKNNEDQNADLWPPEISITDIMRGLYPKVWTEAIGKGGKEEKKKEITWIEIDNIRNRCIYKIWEDRCKAQAEWARIKGITKKI